MWNQNLLDVLNTVLIAIPLWMIGFALLSIADSAKGKTNG